MDETFELIQKFSNERQYLYRLGGKQHLSAAQRQRLDELNGQIPMLWDRHRRELAGSRPRLDIRYERAA